MVVLQEDIFAHVVLTYLHKGCSQDTLRAVVLMFLVVGGQVTIALALFQHCLSELMAYESDLEAALARSASSPNFDVTEDSVIERICGSFHMNHETIADGLGTVFMDGRQWSNVESPVSRIEVLHYQLRVDFQAVFTFVTLFWTWRCFLEVRVAVREMLAVCAYVNSPQEDGAEPSDGSPTSPDRRWEGKGDDEELSDADEKEHQVENVGRLQRCVALLALALRLVVAVFLFGDGYILLCMTERINEVIMNAVALEFIFDIDELVVKAMLAQRERRAFATNKFRVPKQVFKAWNRHRKGTLKKCMLLQTWRSHIWLRMLVLSVIVIMLVVPRNIKVRSLHSRSIALCLTSGLTDGIADIPPYAPEVIFPVPGFCRSFAKQHATIEAPVCAAWRLGYGEAYAHGLCTNTGNLSSDVWHSLGPVQQPSQHMCQELWFGQGVPKGEPVPALRPLSGETTPQMFGCRREDLHFERNTIWWFFYVRGITRVVALSCRRPAFGPKSVVWNTTPLGSSRVLPPEYFFRFDAHSPIEYQVSACNRLSGLRRCNDDPCLVMTDIGSTSCDLYCQERSLVCAEAFTASVGCKLKQRSGLTCSTKTEGRLVCRCELPAEKRSCGLLPAVHARCDGDACSVLVARTDTLTGQRTNFRSCVDYCQAGGKVCIMQFQVRASQYEVATGSKAGQHTCRRDERVMLTCDSPFPGEDGSNASSSDADAPAEAVPPPAAVAAPAAPPAAWPPPPAGRRLKASGGGGNSGSHGVTAGELSAADDDFEDIVDESEAESIHDLEALDFSSPLRVCQCA